MGHQHEVVADLDAALLDDRHDRALEVLIGPHASSDAVHDDADLTNFHGLAPWVPGARGVVRMGRVAPKKTGNPSPLSESRNVRTGARSTVHAYG